MFLMKSRAVIKMGEARAAGKSLGEAARVCWGTGGRGNLPGPQERKPWRQCLAERARKNVSRTREIETKNLQKGCPGKGVHCFSMDIVRPLLKVIMEKEPW